MPPITEEHAALHDAYETAYATRNAVRAEQVELRRALDSALYEATQQVHLAYRNLQRYEYDHGIHEPEDFE